MVVAPELVVEVAAASAVKTPALKMHWDCEETDEHTPFLIVVVVLDDLTSDATGVSRTREVCRETMSNLKVPR